MFTKSTVFIVGAGASNSFGYPLGSQLPAKIRERASELFNFCVNPTRGTVFPDFYLRKVFPNDVPDPSSLEKIWSRIQSDAEILSTRLRDAGKDTIDYFFHQNQSLSDLGRVLMAAEICKNEFDAFTSFNLNNDNKVFGENWIRHVAAHIVRDCDSVEKLKVNKVNFITFNYDLAIERILYSALYARETLHKGSAIEQDIEIKNFVSGDRIIHVYGGLAWDPFSHPTFSYNVIDQYNNAYKYSEEMRIIAPNEKADRKSHLDKAKQLIRDAEVIYILGYGFDENNNKLLALDEPTNFSQNKKVYFTNFDGVKTVDKNFVKAFGLNYDRYMIDISKNNVHHHVHNLSSVRFERSINGVLEALKSEFGFD